MTTTATQQVSNQDWVDQGEALTTVINDMMTAFIAADTMGDLGEVNVLSFHDEWSNVDDMVAAVFNAHRFDSCRFFITRNPKNDMPYLLSVLDEDRIAVFTADPHTLGNDSRRVGDELENRATTWHYALHHHDGDQGHMFRPLPREIAWILFNTNKLSPAFLGLVIGGNTPADEAIDSITSVDLSDIQEKIETFKQLYRPNQPETENTMTVDTISEPAQASVKQETQRTPEATEQILLDRHTDAQVVNAALNLGSAEQAKIAELAIKNARLMNRLAMTTGFLVGVYAVAVYVRTRNF